MATVQEVKKKKQVNFFKFKICVGRDENNRQIFKTTVWQASPELTPARARKAAEAAAYEWEQEIRSNSQENNLNSTKNIDCDETIRIPEVAEDAEAKSINFETYINDIWLPCYAYDGTRRHTTIDYYKNYLKAILEYFKSKNLDEIKSQNIESFMKYLKTKYKTKQGKPLSEQSTKHYYAVLKLVFGYAQKQEIIEKNPMDKVSRPKVRRKPVTAFTKAEAAVFLEALKNCPLDFHCMHYLLITTGLRRGECLGLRWSDIDLTSGIISVNRNVTYTSENGIVVAEPKTANSIRKIPIINGAIALLQELKRETEKKYPHTVLKTAFLFPSNNSPFEAGRPNKVTAQLKRFVKSVGLPDVSPHDLRHPHVKPRLKIFLFHNINFFHTEFLVINI
ncbi:site-specific integrase [Tyzzerella sp. OttesenSCG-928-J15]|nr:site-specific integrase [Tyzzerella sp. OttesenSCG-928-J15]